MKTAEVGGKGEISDERWVDGSRLANNHTAVVRPTTSLYGCVH